MFAVGRMAGSVVTLIISEKWFHLQLTFLEDLQQKKGEKKCTIDNRGFPLGREKWLLLTARNGDNYLKFLPAMIRLRC